MARTSILLSLLALCSVGVASGQYVPLVFLMGTLDPLRTACDSASPPLPDGTAGFQIRSDLNNNGPTDDDPVVPWGANPGQVQFLEPYDLFINGDALLGIPGTWQAESLLEFNGGSPSFGSLANRFWVRLSISDSEGTVTWRGRVWSVPIYPTEPPFYVEIECGPFTCTHVTGCSAPTPVVEFIGDDMEAIPSFRCAELCNMQPTVIRVCSRVPGQPLDPIYVPVLSVFPGCDPLAGYCDVSCEPGSAQVTGMIPYDLWTYVNGCYLMTLVGVDDGCVCIGLEAALGAELSSFAATAFDSRVQIAFATASESNLSRFEITRALRNQDESLIVGSLAARNVATGSEYQFTDHTALNGTTYAYGLAVVELDGTRRTLAALREATPRRDAALISEYALNQNFPNPFNPTTQITFDLVEQTNVNLTVFNMNGQEVATLVNGTVESGRHTVTFDSQHLPSGLYFYTVKIGNGFTATKKMLLLK